VQDFNFNIELSGPNTIITNDTPYKIEIHIACVDDNWEEEKHFIEPNSFYNLDQRLDLKRTCIWFVRQ